MYVNLSLLSSRLLRVLLCGAMLVPQAAYAGPVGGVVAAGAASIAGVGTSGTTVTQDTNRVVIDWQGFDTQAHEQVRFVQPNTNSVALNRVLSGSPTRFDGKLTANGHVVVMNANGVVFGPTAKVDVAGLVATTANTTNEAFMRGGRVSFDIPGNPDAAIVNQGMISVHDAGLAGFVAPSVLNNGVILATLGKAQLAAGDTFTLDLYGDGLVEVAASDAMNRALVQNTGLISANGGTVALTAAQARATVDSLVNNAGIIAATSFENKNGTIILSGAGRNAVAGNTAVAKNNTRGRSFVANSGVLDASGTATGKTGGTVKVLGDHVALGKTSVIAASGHSGGGTVLVGGDYLGTGTTPTAMTTTVSNGALILNDALVVGNGGKSIVWADGATSFAGSIYGRGGTSGGNGGFAETSGKMNLSATGYVDLTATNGHKGTYLLDPDSITIYGNFDPRFQSTDGNINLAANLKLWLDASDQSTLFSDSGGTVQATDGSAVALWKDKSGKENHAAQSNASQRPTWLNGTLNFDGDDYLAGGYDTWQSFFATANHYRDGSNCCDYLWGQAHGDNTNVRLRLSQYAGGGNGNVNDFSNNHIKVNDLTNGYVVDGVQHIVEAIASNPTSFNYGVTNDFYSRYWIGDISEIFVYDNVVSTTASQLLNQYQSAKWGIALQGGGTGSDEASRALAADGYNAFTTRYLERLSTTADVVLQATHDINLDLKGDTLALAANRSLSLTAGDNIRDLSAGTIRTSGTGDITLGSAAIDLSHGTALDASGTGNVTLVADRMALGGDISGHGNLDIHQASTGTAIGLVDVSGGLDLDASELDHIKDGFSHINIGRNDGTNSVFVGDTIWHDPVTFRGNNLIKTQNLVGSGDASFTFVGNGATTSRVDMLGNITTNGGNADFSGVTYIYTPYFVAPKVTTQGGNIFISKISTHQTSGSLDFNSGGGDITVNNSFDVGTNPDNQTLTFNAGNGSLVFHSSLDTGYNIKGVAHGITLTGAWGATDRMGNVSLVSIADLSISSIRATSISAMSGGDLILNGDINVSGTGNITLVANRMALGGDISGHGNLDIHQANTNTAMGLNWATGGLDLDAAELGRIKDGFSHIDIGRNDSGVGLYVGATTWRDPVTFHGNDLIALNGNISGLGDASFTFTGNGAGASRVDMYDAVLSTAGQYINFGGVQYVFAGNTVSSVVNSNGGWIYFPQIVNVNGGKGLFVSSGGGDITVGREIVAWNQTSGETLDFNAGSGNLTFNGTVNTGFNLTAQANSITMNSDWGQSQRLGAVTLTSTGTGLSLSSIRAASVMAKSGTNSDLTLRGVTDVSGSGNALVLAAGRNFVNNAGANAIVTPNGRALVYSTAPESDTMGGLSGFGRRYNSGFASYAPMAVTGMGNMFLYNNAYTLSVTAQNATRVYGDANPAFGYTLNGLRTGDSAGGFTVGSTAAQASNVGTYAIAAGQGSFANDQNYTLDFINGTLSITPATLTVAAQNATRVYGDANPGLNYTVMGLKNADIATGFSIVTPANQTSHVGNYSVAPGNGSFINPNYTTNFVNGTLSIMPATLTVAAQNVTRSYGNANPALNYAVTGLRNGDTVTGIAVDSIATQASNVGTYSIALGNGSFTNPNYTLNFVNGTLSVTPAPLTVTARSATRLYGDANPVLGYDVAGLKNGDTATGFSIGTIAHQGSNVGNYAIALGNGSYANPNYAVSLVNGALSITPATLSVTARNTTRLYGDANPILGYDIAGYRNTDDATVISGLLLSTAATVTSDVGNYAITGAGATAANYMFAYADGVMTVAPATLNVSARNATRVQGAGNPSFLYDVTGYRNNDNEGVIGNLVLASQATVNSTPGNYVISAGSATATNYIFAYTNGFLTVTPKPLPPAQPPLPPALETHAPAPFLPTTVIGISSTQMPPVSQVINITPVLLPDDQPLPVINNVTDENSIETSAGVETNAKHTPWPHGCLYRVFGFEGASGNC